MVEISANNAGESFSVAVGQTLNIRLPCNPTTGYNWFPHGLPDYTTVESAFIRGGAQTKMGAGGTAVFKITPTAPGTFGAKFLHRRKWDEPDEDIEQFNILVTAT